ncbi:MAG: efflux RND transporter periplasmic adaptor subunit [Gammaproteobacteria bacterium]|nr:efflux RND transporter periplasmic adaptor subunit [Gammaproteobacteria bacterium]QOJ31198.1 MAG: efflux RND transporter periplasmic adaptor subunit [Gammaproteobacteria bacterium]
MPRPTRFPAGARWLAALALTGLITACGGKAPAPEATPSLSVTATRLATRPLERSLVASGSVAAWQEMSLGVELSGVRVTAVLVEVGDRVKPGQVLLRLDARTLEVQARQADAALEQAKANLALARAANARGDSLLERKLISTADADQLKANLISAEAKLTTAQADRDAARLKLGFATLEAPQAGVISARSVEPGQVVSAGAELLRLIRDGRLEWRAELAEGDFARVREGAAVELTAADGAMVRGWIRAVSPALDPQTRTGLVYADLPEPGTLRAGMFAQGRILLGTVQASVLPREAVVFRDGLPYVFVLQGSADVARVTQQRIGVGIQQGEITEVTSGLGPDDRVVARGAGFLGDGDLVRVLPAQAAAAPAEPPR